MAILEDHYEINTVDTWYQFQEDYDREMIRAAKNAKWFKDIKQPGLTDWLQYDMDRAKRIHDDIASLLKLVERGTYKLNETRLDNMLTVLSTATLVLECDNDALEMAFEGGLSAAIVLLPWVLIKNKAIKLQQALIELKKKLEVAKKERNEAYAQTAINVSLTVVTVLLPQIGLLARGGMLVGQIFVDNALGPSTSDAATRASQGNTTASHLSGAIEDTSKVTQRTKSIAKGGGHATVVVGFAFDVNEVMTGHANVATIVAVMEKAKSELEHLQKFIKLNKPKIDNFLARLKEWETEIGQVTQSAESTRVDLDNFMDQVSYHP